jgi:hypothetical protein
MINELMASLSLSLSLSQTNSIYCSSFEPQTDQRLGFAFWR